MTPANPETPDPIDRLNVALETLASALVMGSADAVLAVEEPLATAAAALADQSLSDAPRLRRAVTRASLTLGRCLALGQSAGAFAQAIGAADLVYGRSGQPITAPLPSSRLSRP